MKLYELPETYREWMMKVEENEGEIDDALGKELEAIEENLATKVDAYCALIRQFSAEEKAYEFEAKRLSARAHSAKGRIDRLKRMMLETFQRLDIKSVRGKRFVVRVMKATMPSINWVSPQPIPEPFQRTNIELDKLAAIDALKEVGTLPEGFKVEYKEYINIW